MCTATAIVFLACFWPMMYWSRWATISRGVGTFWMSIARGGLVLAASLAYALGVKSCFVLNIEYYTGVGRRLDAPVVLPPLLDLEEASGARVLIADDVADTGHTLDLVRSLCVDKVAEARIAVLYEKPTSTISCEYVWRPTDRWIEFPWSSEPPLVASEEFAAWPRRR